MSLTIELPRPLADRLEAEASRAGVSPTDYAAELIVKHLPTASIDVDEQKRRNTPSVALLESWLLRAELPCTPEESAEAERELVVFMRNMNAQRAESGDRLLYPDIDV